MCELIRVRIDIGYVVVQYRQKNVLHKRKDLN